MQLTGVDLLLWAASFLGHVTLLIVLFARGRARRFPVFTTFVAASVVRTIALFGIQRYGTKADYFYTYWSLAILDVLLQLGIVIEISSLVFRPGGRWAADVKRHLAYWVAGSIITAGLLTSLAAPEAELLVQRVMIKGNFFTSALMSELLAGMIFLSVKAGLPLRTHVARICEGFGVYSLAQVLIEAAHTYFGLRRGDRIYIDLSHLRIAIYLTGLLYWILTLWQNVPQAEEKTELVRDQLAELRGLVNADLSALKSRRHP